MTNKIIDLHFGTFMGCYALWSKKPATLSCDKTLQSWPKHTYSRERALNQADRLVGEMVRLSDAGTQFTYTQEIPKI